MKRELRFKVTDQHGYSSFVTVLDGHVGHRGSAGVCLSLAYISKHPVELEFALTDAESHRYDGSKSGGNLGTPNALCLEAFKTYAYSFLTVTPLTLPPQICKPKLQSMKMNGRQSWNSPHGSRTGTW